LGRGDCPTLSECTLPNGPTPAGAQTEGCQKHTGKEDRPGHRTKNNEEGNKSPGGGVLRDRGEKGVRGHVKLHRDEDPFQWGKRQLRFPKNDKRVEAPVLPPVGRRGVREGEKKATWVLRRSKQESLVMAGRGLGPGRTVIVWAKTDWVILADKRSNRKRNALAVGVKSCRNRAGFGMPGSIIQ